MQSLAQALHFQNFKKRKGVESHDLSGQLQSPKQEVMPKTVELPLELDGMWHRLVEAARHPHAHHVIQAKTGSPCRDSGQR